MNALIVASDKLERIPVRAEDDSAVKWNAAFALYGGHGTTQSSTIVYEIEPGGHLGWHTDATEETQYIIAGSGELLLEDGSKHAVGPETLRAVAFFAAAMFTQTFDNMMLPPKTHVLGTPNRNG